MFYNDPFFPTTGAVLVDPKQVDTNLGFGGSQRRRGFGWDHGGESRQ